MPKIWVEVNTSVSADGAEAIKSLTPTLKAAITPTLISKVTGALPCDKFTTLITDKPTAQPKSGYNAIKLTIQLKVKLELKGSAHKIATELKLTFEAIKAPAVGAGDLLGSGTSTANVENAGTTETSFARSINDGVDAVAKPLVTTIITNARFNSYGKTLGLPL